MPLGPLAPGRIGEIVECPYCGEHALQQEDYKNPTSGSTEKETLYLHFDGSVLIKSVKNGRDIEEVETIFIACPAKIKQ
jgi:hypothetical protein